MLCDLAVKTSTAVAKAVARRGSQRGGKPRRLSSSNFMKFSVDSVVRFRQYEPH
jgi:hypothetical protein